jgi:catechol 2,3-dioxygenase-like lactoylglutathione lyase family enzyme
MGRWLLALLLLLGSPAMAQIQVPVQGLDHIPIVVRDLDRAAADFTALGFVLKPGRPHGNGLRNVHAKFPDGTELELISPGTPTDDLSRRYVDWLKQGDGPISLGLFAPSLVSVWPPLEGIFFDGRQKSPTDRPEHFAHPNGARTLAAVWLADSPSERLLIALAEGRLIEQSPCAPFGVVARALRLPEGEVVLLPASAQRLAGRPVIAASVEVASLDAVRRLVLRTAVDCPRSLWIESHGLWLEFRER